jgi:hypothetical protein
MEKNDLAAMGGGMLAGLSLSEDVQGVIASGLITIIIYVVKSAVDRWIRRPEKKVRIRRKNP